MIDYEQTVISGVVTLADVRSLIMRDMARRAGRSRSEKKIAASRANVAKARAVRMARIREERAKNG